LRPLGIGCSESRGRAARLLSGFCAAGRGVLCGAARTMRCED
jgi:hypothetical protein